jgi:hypothetical protein
MPEPKMTNTTTDKAVATVTLPSFSTSLKQIYQPGTCITSFISDLLLYLETDPPTLYKHYQSLGIAVQCLEIFDTFGFHKGGGVDDVLLGCDAV